ncbi:hypothetical protein BJ170DRAFT_230128 [Xylariales sp. AK1849]|nr:hypothetical protein BJ170DRAFT_230128 [Xylariales sp. AK1849]
MTLDLKSLLTSDLFKLMVDTRIPFSRSEPIDYGKAIQQTFFDAGGEFSKIGPKAWPALKALSLLGLDNIPDMMEFLPPPEAPDFPEQALGLQILLDQAPRALLRGVDVRWTNAYFDDISIRYSKQLRGSLPLHMNPTSWSRWEGSVSIDWFIFARLWFGAPLVHHEQMAEAALAFTDETRKSVEKIFNTRDPYVDQPEERWDLYGFPKLLKAGGPKSPCGVAEGWFWLALLMDVHKPLLDLYGRYPYRNAPLGRVATPEEEEWMEKVVMFKADPAVEKRIRDDVEAGRWTPLGNDEGEDEQ